MRWSRDFAYAVGLITTDGYLSKDGRHLDLTSKDIEQINNFKNILHLKNKIGIKRDIKNKNNICFRIQFGNVKLYRYLISVGLSNRKSKTLTSLKIPDRYYPDFLRGCFDGDGYSTSYWSKQWSNSFVLYSGFTSGSLDFLKWMQNKITNLYNIKGYIEPGTRVYILKYAKYNSLKLFDIMYYSDQVVCLKRKKFKIDKALGIIQLQV